jgi:hypothetical protein
MKVEKLIEILQKSHKGTDDICVLWWSKPWADETIDDFILTDENWAEVCAEFDAWQDADFAISEWVADAVLQHSTEAEDNRG